MGLYLHFPIRDNERRNSFTFTNTYVILHLLLISVIIFRNWLVYANKMILIIIQEYKSVKERNLENMYTLLSQTLADIQHITSLFNIRIEVISLWKPSHFPVPECPNVTRPRYLRCMTAVFQTWSGTCTLSWRHSLHGEIIESI